MDSVFDPAAYRQLLTRLEALTPDAARQWGTMTAAQMMEHVARTVDMATGVRPAKQLLVGRLISWVFKPGFVGPKPFQRGAPTGPDFRVADAPDFQRSRERLKSVLAVLHGMGAEGCDGHVHAFFGRLSGAEWGMTQHKHLDHHLRQFGV